MYSYNSVRINTDGCGVIDSIFHISTEKVTTKNTSLIDMFDYCLLSMCIHYHVLYLYLRGIMLVYRTQCVSITTH